MVEFNKVISGTGSVERSGPGIVALSGTNTYSGTTDIYNGTLQAGAANAFSPNSAVTLGYNSTLDLNNFSQTIRSLASVLPGSGSVTLGGGTLTAGDNNNTTFRGVISGSGGLTKRGSGTLNLSGTNTYAGPTAINVGTLQAGAANAFSPNSAVTLAGQNSYGGGTDLKQGGIAVGTNSALGTGELAMHEGTTLRFAADGLTLANPIAFTDAVDPIIDTGPFTATLTGAITGPGDLSKIGSGTLVLSGANSYSGATAVTEGTLRAGAANTFSPASAHSVAAGATLDLAGFSQGIGALTNAGTVSLIGSAPGTTLTFTGPYVGNNGLLRLGTFLGDSASISDRLVLSGLAAVASGRTTVQVVNLGGLGALTTGNGIELVSALSLYGEVGKLWASGGDTRVKSQLNASAGLRVRW
ncbi:autotransporter-associated beta strand repeat-containing protein [Variovorax sp. RA8]|uniref:autotransporter-associated beta strand repeat-containing protein n=1 Tax=Variovorax sp. (strain JCM 16519 / RA8) TaxID=662548 RepID=UPI0022B29799|nr:autotransporter-associated beta strand repeat-containing protein [Variovorax sp. RA8]